MKTFFSRLSPGQYAIASFLIGFVVVALELTYYPQGYRGLAGDELLVFFPSFFWGLGGCILSIYGETPQKGIVSFILWKLPLVGVMIVFWALSFLSLYNYVVKVLK